MKLYNLFLLKGRKLYELVVNLAFLVEKKLTSNCFEDLDEKYFQAGDLAFKC